MAFRKTALILKFQNFLQDFRLPSPIKEIQIEGVENTFYFIQDELIHPVVSGNKWRKLQGHFNYFYQVKYKSISTVGSAHSNYLHAIAYCCYILEVPLTVYIYGNGSVTSPMKRDLINWGVDLVNIDRSEVILLESKMLNPEVFFIPEGGNEYYCRFGLKQMLLELPNDFDQDSNTLYVAYGSGSTVRSILEETKAIHLQTLSPVKSMVKSYIHHRLNWLDERKNFAFAAYSLDLLEFVENMFVKTKILLDPVYTSRLLFSISHNRNLLEHYTKSYILHTGGLQAWRSFLERYPRMKMDFPHFYEYLQAEIVEFSK